MDASSNSATGEPAFRLPASYDLDLPVCADSFRRIPHVSWQFMLDDCERTLPFLNRQRRAFASEASVRCEVEFSF